MDVVDAGMLGDEVSLGDGVDLGAVELRAEDGELVGTDEMFCPSMPNSGWSPKQGQPGLLGWPWVPSSVVRIW